MKVTRNTPDQLILADIPWFIGIMLIIFILAFVGPGLMLASTGGENIIYGLIFAFGGGGLGFGAFCVFVRRVQVVLDRPNDQITIRRQSVFGYQSVTHKLSDLDRAEVESTTSRRDGRTSTLHRAVLVLNQGMSAGRHP
ncbi:MAG: hypothetical protein AAF408_17630, partial [Pseudomonadota bacterium]